MLPALKAGSFVLGKKFTSDFVSLLTGKSVIVFFDEIRGRTLVKRITKVDSFEKKVFVAGDNQRLSAKIEPVDFSRVLAIVTSVSSP